MTRHGYFLIFFIHPLYLCFSLQGTLVPFKNHSVRRLSIMKKYILLIVVLYLLPAVVRAQTYKYIGVEDGLSNRQVYAIEKDRKGYMWFLTPEGLDATTEKTSSTTS